MHEYKKYTHLPLTQQENIPQKIDLKSGPLVLNQADHSLPVMFLVGHNFKFWPRCTSRLQTEATVHERT